MALGESNRSTRSSVPDLLFEDIRDSRIAEIRSLLDDPRRVCASSVLHRVTVFLTYRCNLDCPYCKTIARGPQELRAAPQKGVTMSYREFDELLRSLAPAPIRHVHFTGGEATMVRDLSSMVRLAHDRGVERLSITSNGTMPYRIYAALVEAGMDEIRISIDACEATSGELLTQRRGAWQKAVNNILALVKLRDAGAKVFVIANTVVEASNRVNVPSIVRFLLSLGVDDIKLITSVDARDCLADFPEAASVLREMRALLRDHPDKALPLLRRKIETVFSPESIGLEQVTPQQDWRCYIPLTERTVDGVYYYPCSVYLREGGQPLGRIDDSMEEQRVKTADFVIHGDCLHDPICRRYCLHCTRQFNVAANEARKELVVRPFVLVTPLGVPVCEQLQIELDQFGVRVTKKTRLKQWRLTAALLYGDRRRPAVEREQISSAYDRLWRAETALDEAEQWELASVEDLQRALTVKAEVRRRLGATRQFQLQDRGLEKRTVRLNPIHVPDVDRWEWEGQLLAELRRRAGST
jgi:MoaA/NifB/PqqE/SkfB family radical SAM enzyme